MIDFSDRKQGTRFQQMVRQIGTQAQLLNTANTDPMILSADDPTEGMVGFHVFPQGEDEGMTYQIHYKALVEDLRDTSGWLRGLIEIMRTVEGRRNFALALLRNVKNDDNPFPAKINGDTVFDGFEW